MNADKRRWDNSAEQPDAPAWFGCLRRYARGKNHSMRAIRKSIKKARKQGAC